MFLTIPEAAKKLKVHQNTIRNIIKKGDLPIIRVGRQIRIKECDFDKISDRKILMTNALQNAGFSNEETEQIIEIINKIIQQERFYENKS